MAWIHEHKDWPTLNWDIAALSHTLSDIRHRQGFLLGRMEALGFDARQEANLAMLASDIVKSSAIEGEVLDPKEVRSSIAKKLGLDIGGALPPSRAVEGVVEMMFDATNQYQKPLTKERLFDWHAALFPTGRSGMARIEVGGWRPVSKGSMQVISGPIGKEIVHFEAPHASRLESEMDAFLNWFEKRDAIDPVLKAGIAHFWFVTIHPFEDGNGRIARAIADMALARADQTQNRFYSMSTQIESEKKIYYSKLEKQQRGDTDITGWLLWFLECLGRAFGFAEEMLSQTIFKSKLWNHVNQDPVNKRQRLVLNRMLDGFKGFITSSKYAKIAKCSQDTALRDIRGLIERGVFFQNPGGGRNASYRLANSNELDTLPG